MISDIYIVDDDQGMRDSLSALLEAHDYQVHTFVDGETFLHENLLDIKGPILLDVRMPGRSGIDVLTEALKYNPHLAVIIISGHGDIPMAVRALKKGALSFIEKPFKPNELLHEIDQLKEHIAVSEGQRAKRSETLNKLKKLTPREQEIMRHLVNGKPNKIIAADLGLSVRTIEAHRARLLLKLEVKSLSDLVRMSLLST